MKRKKPKATRKRTLKEADSTVLSGNMVLADQSKQVPNNSYGPPVVCYIDKPFNCVDCGKSEVWTAQQQKWYYEVAKGSLYAKAIRCRGCRKQHTELFTGKGDPHPIKHVGSLMKRLRLRIEPTLLQTGFQFDGKTQLPLQKSVAINYSKDNLLLVCTFCRFTGTLTAETLDNSEVHTEIARVTLTRADSSQRIIERIHEFAEMLTQRSY